jgi:hypothetical protein
MPSLRTEAAAQTVPAASWFAHATPTAAAETTPVPASSWKNLVAAGSATRQTRLETLDPLVRTEAARAPDASIKAQFTRCARYVADNNVWRGCAAAAAGLLGTLKLATPIVALLAPKSAAAALLSLGVGQLAAPLLLLGALIFWGSRTFCDGAESTFSGMTTPERGAAFGAGIGAAAGLAVGGLPGAVAGACAGAAIGIALGSSIELVHQGRRLFAWATGGDPGAIRRLDDGQPLLRQLQCYAMIMFILAGLGLGLYQVHLFA